MDFDVLAFIGRFQPFHNGHKAIVDVALERAKKVAIVIGCHDQPRDTRNPFTTADRIEMITAVYPDEVREGRIAFVPQIDYRYNDDRWLAGVQTGVSTVANTPFTPDPVRIGLIGHSKDQSSYYLKKFPTWDSVDVENFDGIDATTIRRAYLADGLEGTERALLPAAVLRWLYKTIPDMDNLGGAPWYRNLRAEAEAEGAYKKPSRMPTDKEMQALISRHLPEEHHDAGKDLIAAFAKQFKSPYAPTFHTVDAVVVQSGHVLLVERGAMPGKGLWALPGGFLEQGERLIDGAIRELYEETKIALSADTLRRCISKERAFDDPHRSQRGRTLTTAFLIELRPDVKLTKVKGADDAAKARWVPLSDIRRSQMFEDHYDIIAEMTGAL